MSTICLGPRGRSTLKGLPPKDFLDDTERFHRLRIPECFAYDIEGELLLGWPLRGDRYETIRPKGFDRRVTSSVLDLDVAVIQGRVCFYHGATRLPDADELIERLSTMADDAVHRAEQEARRADGLAARLRELGVDPEEFGRLS